MRNYSLIAALSVLTFMISQRSLADGFAECGVYRLEGQLRASSTSSVLFINRGSHSQVEISLPESASLKLLSDGPATALVKIVETCRYKCRAESIEIVELIDPFEIPKNPFLGGLRPERPIKCKATPAR